MKVAIAGAGVAGSYCARLLRTEGYEVDLYDLPHRNPCGIAPCAWMTAVGIDPLLADVGLDYQDYILARFSSVRFEDLEVQADLMTIDKPRLIGDLQGGIAVTPGSPDPVRYDRIIDATGTARAFLPPIGDDRLAHCVQVRVRVSPALPSVPEIRYVNGGYAWSFPLGRDLRHIGCISHLADPVDLLQGSHLLEAAVGPVLCRCRSSLRVTAPSGALPFVSPDLKVWGVGEAIGCVYPIVGEGIVPALQSVRLLLGCMDDPAAYTAAVMGGFPQMEAERAVLLALEAGLMPGPVHLLRAGDLKRLGIQIGAAGLARIVARVHACTPRTGGGREHLP